MTRSTGHVRVPVRITPTARMTFLEDHRPFSKHLAAGYCLFSLSFRCTLLPLLTRSTDTYTCARCNMVHLKHAIQLHTTSVRDASSMCSGRKQYIRLVGVKGLRLPADGSGTVLDSICSRSITNCDGTISVVLIVLVVFTFHYYHSNSWCHLRAAIQLSCIIQSLLNNSSISSASTLGELQP